LLPLAIGQFQQQSSPVDYHYYTIEVNVLSLIILHIHYI
jgi:hypothetical protein